jgi:hypothetical protein
MAPRFLWKIYQDYFPKIGIIYNKVQLFFAAMEESSIRAPDGMIKVNCDAEWNPIGYAPAIKGSGRFRRDHS